MSGLRLDVADLLAQPGARRAVVLAEPLEGLVGSATRVDGPVELTLSFERISDGIVVRGRLHGRWQGECSSCLRELDRAFELHVDELFEAEPLPGETYPIEGHLLDLEQLVRDAVLLELPLAPRCNEPCTPELPHEADDPVDPRWAALSELEL